MPTVPVAYLFDCNGNLLGEYELARLNEVANLEKQLIQMIRQIIERSVEAEFAAWLRENKHELRDMACNSWQGKLAFPAREAIERSHMLRISRK